MNNRERYEVFQDLLLANDQGLESLARIRGSSTPIENHSAALEHARNMLDIYDALSEGKENEQLASALEKIEFAGHSAVEQLQLIKQFDYEDSSVLEIALDDVFSRVESISPAIEDPYGKSFAPESIATLHDMIRYLHQKSVEVMFTPKLGGDESNSHHVSFPYLDHYTFTLNVIDLGGGLDIQEDETRVTSEPLQGFMDGFSNEEQNTKNMRSQSGYVFASEDFMDLSSKVGTHIGLISARIREGRGDNYIRFRLWEWEDKGRKQARMKYVSRVLESYGFTAGKPMVPQGTECQQGSSSGIQIDARIEGVSADSARELIGHCGRLLVTMNNLDWGIVNHRQKENTQVLEACVERFLEGHYDIPDFAQKMNDNPYRRC